MLIECPFCNYSTDDCDVCDGFGVFNTDLPEEEFMSTKNKTPIQEAIAQNPMHVLGLLKKWFENAATDLSENTGTYIFYRDIAKSLDECEDIYRSIADYEAGISGQRPSCIISLWESTQL